MSSGSIRIIQLPEKSSVNTDDYMAVDSSANGTKKVKFTDLLDDNLSVQNKAADAQATGEAINATSEAINDVNARVDNMINTQQNASVTTLWTGTLNTYNQEVTLSDNISNYDFIDIYVSQLDYKFLRRPVNAIGNHIQLQGQNMLDSGSTDNIQFWEGGLNISGNKAKIVKANSMTMYGYDTYTKPTGGVNTSIPSITRIDGVKIGHVENDEIVDARVGANGITYPTLGDAIRGQIIDVNNINEMLVFPEETSFVDIIDNQLMQKIPFADTRLNIIKFSGLIPYNNKFITSSGFDSYAFRVPYDNFEFGIESTTASTTAYALSSMPLGTSGETLNIINTIEGEQSGYNINYSINNKRGTIVLFVLNIADVQIMISSLNNAFSIERLELNNIQDHFLRYGNIKSTSSDKIPMEVTKKSGYLVNTTTGGISQNSSYDTYYFQVPVNSMEVTCTNGFRAVITSQNPEDINVAGFLERIVYSNSSGRVETFTATLGEFVVFSLLTAQAPIIDLKTDLVKAIELPTLRLTYGQKNSFYKYEASGTAKYLYIYYVSGEKLVRYELHNVPVPSTNSNTWQLGHIMGYDFDGRSVSNGVELVAGGEFELAFKEYGAADYCGGNNHGDETTDSFSLFIDGKAITFESLDSEYHLFDRIDAVEIATVNRCDTPSEPILKHQKQWIFENGKVQVKQTLNFLETMECDFLCCMMAANRSYFKHGIRWSQVGIEDLTTSSAQTVNTFGNEMSYLMYGDNVTAKVKSITCDHEERARLWINRAETINKLYYNFYSNPRTSVTSGTTVWWEAEYDVAYN